MMEIRQTFNDSLQAREWEHKVLRRLKVIQDERWLNKGSFKSIPSQLGIPKPQKWKEKMLGNQNAKGNHQRKTEEHRKKIAAALKGKRRSEESNRKQSNSMKGKRSPNKGKIYERIKCPNCGCLCSIGGNYNRWHGDKCRSIMDLSRCFN